MLSLTYKQKYTAKAMALLIISPVYVPVMVLWDNRGAVRDFYKETFKIIRGTHPDLNAEGGNK